MVEEQIELRAKLYPAIQALGELLAEGHTVYLHCTAGIGRAPTVAIGYLHTCLGWNWDAAVAHVKQARECAPHVEALRLALGDQGILKSSKNGGARTTKDSAREGNGP